MTMFTDAVVFVMAVSLVGLEAFIYRAIFLFFFFWRYVHQSLASQHAKRKAI